MQIHRLRLQNYKQYVELDLEFREGLVGIIGRNGAGKSTLFDAILYCLYGREEAGKTLVRSSFADPKATVVLELEFFVGENLYRARREFRGKALTPYAELYKNDALVAKTTKAVNDEVAKVLHMERDAFKRSVFSGQKELDDLTKATREERRKQVRRMLGLERLDEIQTTINADARDTRNRILGQMQNLLTEAQKTQITADIAEGEKQLAQLQQTLQQEKQQLQTLNQQYQQTKVRFEEAEQRLKRHNELAQRIEQARERIQQLAQRQQELQQKIAQLNTQRRQVEAQRPQFETYLIEKKRLDALENDRQKYLNQKVRVERLAAAREELARAQRNVEARVPKVEKLPAVLTELEEKKQKLAQVQIDIETCLDEHSRLKGEIAALQMRVKERTNQLDQLRALGRGGACPTCLQPLLDGYDNVLRELESEIQQLVREKIQALEQKLQFVVLRGKALRAKEHTLKREEEELRAQKLALEEDARQKSLWERDCRKWEEHIAAEEAILRAIGEVKFDEAAYDALKARVKAEDARYLEFTKAENYVEQELPRALREQKTVQEALAQSQQDWEALTAEQQAIGYDPVEYEAARDALTAFADQLRAQSERVQGAEKACLEQQNTVQNLQEQLERDIRLQEQICDQRAEIELLEKLSALIGQFKGEILARVGPGISREASELFNRITRGRYESIRVNDDFDFSISDGGNYYPIERFSGGEVDLANLCLRIAITKAIFDLSGATQMAGFLAFDEVLGSQDEERRVEIMLAFNYLKEQFRQIYIISHIESLKDFFPNLLEVSVGPEGSRAVWK
ncbi:MAG: SMC family ATPase [Saprospiraceae bacterium]|nr:SMC family ATPase [Saprospiraceae bacterium]MDW8228571.1 SMC family ATPase [Saprospiraceae bacterium]